jgi:hypothetical protein
VSRTTAYRLAAWRRPLRTEPSRLAGRFHRATEDCPTQYACLHPLGPWAEFLRATGLRGPEQLALVRQRTWALQHDLSRLARIGFAEAAEHGLEPADLVADDHAACHALADRLRAAGAPGAVVPSAALPGTDNVVLFGPRVPSPYGLSPVGRVDVPASLTADGGRPPVGLLEAVRRPGGPHAALDAWRAGRPFRFREPSWAEWPPAAGLTPA